MNRVAVALGALGALALLMVSRGASASEATGYGGDLWETDEPIWNETDFGELILETPQTRDVYIPPATGGQWDILPPVQQPASPYEIMDDVPPAVSTGEIDYSGSYTDEEGYTYYFDVAGNYVGYSDIDGNFYPTASTVIVEQTTPDQPSDTPETPDTTPAASSVGDWLTAQHFARLYPRALPGTYPPLVQAMDYYSINTPDRVAGFLAVVASESGGFTRMVESLAYNAERAFTIFGPRRITSVEDARQLLAQGPEAFAERVYGMNSGTTLGNNQPGDGYRYIGHWWTQLTGRANHAAVGARLGLDLVGDPDAYLDVDTAAWVSGDYWNSRSLNDPADERDIVEITRRVAGTTRDDYVAYKRSYYNAAAPIVAQAATDYGIA